MLRRTAITLAASAAALTATLTGCNDDGEPQDKSHGTFTTSSPSVAGALEVRCVKLSAAQVSAALALDEPYTTDKYHPCGGQWNTDLKWEDGEGADSLDGQPSGASLDVAYIDFPDAATAQKQFELLRQAAQSNVGQKASWWVAVEPYDAGSGNEAFMVSINAMGLRSIGTGGLGSSIDARCGARVVMLGASKATLYQNTYTDEVNTLKRGRNPVDVRADMQRAFQSIAAPLCGGSTPDSAVVGQYTPPTPGVQPAPGG